MNINGFIWSIADDVLHHVYDRTKYRDNRSPFTLRQLLARPNPETQKADFEAYLDGFSENVREVIARFSP